MNVRTKMISVLALLFAVLIVLDIGIQKHVLMPSFAELERDDARTSMRRIDNVLNFTLDNLQLNAADWGNWADAYKFVQGLDTDFAKTNITAAALKQMQVNTVMLVNLKGNVVVASSGDLDSGAPIDIDLSANTVLPENFPWRRNVAEGKPAKGLIKTNRGVMMLAGAPILDGSGRGPWMGMVIMGRILTPQQVRQIGAQAQANVSMNADHRPAGAEELIETDTATEVSRRFADIYGNPLLTLRVNVPRKITERGQSAVSYASTYLMVAALAALTLLVIVLNRVVLAPLARVTRHAVAIGEGTDLTARLSLPGRDEVAVLAGEFDRMVERVAESRRQLMDQSFQAGFAELAKGVLHNLGNAMTPLGVRLSKLGERLRDAPMADVELAAGELAREPPGSERYRDLQEFLRLGCRELGGALKEAQADVMVIQRQTTIVQTALSELMRSTHNEHVVESVRLPDLVSQTLEIVPDACRQRLVVESDDSLRRVGVVNVARTVLRLVLQNLIINAADAVREAGRDKGVFRVVAEIVRDSERDQLHLHCEDNGIGIAHGNLERVFDQGFSTKSRDTNYGIGLHWCANAISALGGRIWAVSDGPGRGASMHLMLPLTIRPAPLNP
ncbi:MAG TPA: CHASE4 domain-containing protein [Steroidobacteraceae bacterium]|nr:CHASE4 domain-containing protein [Steroidobacteraceae bacterium]